MLRFTINRILISLIIIWGVITIIFVIMHLVPGDPASIYIRPEINPDVVANIRRQMGLDLPVWKQYFAWITEILKGNFGVSYVHQKPVAEIIGEALGNTIQLTGSVFIFQLFTGIMLGVVSALKKNTKTDHLINSVLLFLYSMPGFWLALVLLLVFSLKLGWLPSSQMESLYGMNGFWAVFWDRIRHLILPVFVLSTPFIAYTAQFIRQKLIEELAKPYILAAKTYGISKNKIIYTYALKNAALPLVTLLGLYLPFLLGGAVITEYIFSWPGIGRITVNAIFAHDYPLILTTTLIAAFAVIAGNFISDVLYHVADPRIRTENRL